MPDRPTVICTANRKGGCFKTSGIFHLSGAFAADKKRVLLIDMDPQGSLSQTFFGSQKVESLPAERSLAALFDEHGIQRIEDIIYQTHLKGIYICPACDALGKHNDGEPVAGGWKQDVIDQMITEVGHHFDVVLIDTPPNLQLLTWAAMVAADFVITPVIPEEYAAQGLVHVRRFIDGVGAGKNPKIRWLGLLLAMVQSRVSVHAAYEEKLREVYGELVFHTKIPLAAVFKEAVSAKTPVADFNKKTPGARAIGKLYKEITARIQSQAAPVNEAA